MKPKVLELLYEEQAQLEETLSAKKKLIREVEAHYGVQHNEELGNHLASSQWSTRYVNIRLSRLLMKLLMKRKSWKPNELIDELVSGGAALNKKRGPHNIRLAINTCIQSGRFIYDGVTLDALNSETIYPLLEANKGSIRLNTVL